MSNVETGNFWDGPRIKHCMHDELSGSINIITLNDHESLKWEVIYSDFYVIFGGGAHLLNCAEMAGGRSRQPVVRCVKFSALNVDFSSLNFGSLFSRSHLHRMHG